MKKTFQDFRDFITTGNLIAIAIGLLMGAEIGRIVASFTENLFTPIFAMIGGKPDFSEVLILEINDAQFRFGSFLTSIFNFLIVAAVAFLIVKASAKLFPPKDDPAGPTEIELLTEIRDSLKK